MSMLLKDSPNILLFVFFPKQIKFNKFHYSPLIEIAFL